jgi:hypothetical protein
VPVSASGHLPGSARDHSGSAVHDLVALEEIELCCELMIAASTESSDRLGIARIDEVLRVALLSVPRQRRRPGADAGDGAESADGPDGADGANSAEDG